MGELIQGYAMVITSWINFLFQLKFNDGTTVGGILLAVCVLSLIIRFIFRPTWAGTVNSDVRTVHTRARQYGMMEESIDRVSSKR